MTVELGSTDRNLFGGVRKKCTTTSTDQTKISFSKSDEAPSSDYRCTSFLLLGGSAALDLHEDGGEDKIRRCPDVSGRASEVKASESIDRVHSMVRDISSQLTQGFNTPRPSTEIYLVGPSTINPPSIKFSSAIGSACTDRSITRRKTWSYGDFFLLRDIPTHFTRTSLPQTSRNRKSSGIRHSCEA